MSSKEDPEFNKVTGRWEYEDDNGQVYEKDQATEQWIEVVDEELMKAQQAAYSVPGVDENAPIVPVKKKRKIQETFTQGPDGEGDGAAAAAPGTGNGRANKKDRPEQKSRETAVYVQNLPLDATEEEVASLFGKCGLLLEDPISGKPRVKLYSDAQGNRKGDGIVIYLREESISLAIQMIDDTSLRGDARLLKVSKATFTPRTAKKDDGPRRPRDETIKKKASQRAGKLRSKLADWDEDEATEVSRSTKFDKIVILKGMFSLDELESDPSLLLDLKEDVREECARLGEVTNVVLYDREADGVMSVRFKDESQAEACIKLMHGRYFGGRQVVAEVFDGKRRYLKSGRDDGGEDGEGDEEQRLAKFGAWLEGEQ